MAGRKVHLTQDQKEKIKKLSADGVTQDVLAERFGTSKNHIYDIIKRKKA